MTTSINNSGTNHWRSWSNHIPNDSLTQRLVRIFEQNGGFDRIPELQWQGRFHGDTNQFDGIEPKDLTSPVMRGLDPNGRCFIVVRILHPATRTKGTEIFFQRFSDSYQVWHNAGPSLCKNSPSVQCDEDIERICALIQGKRVELPDGTASVILDARR